MYNILFIKLKLQILLKVVEKRTDFFTGLLDIDASCKGGRKCFFFGSLQDVFGVLGYMASSGHDGEW
jgi:hypothetical protein